MRKPKAPKIVTIAIMTTITIIFWIFLTLYRVLTTKPAPSVDPKLLEPINPTLDVQNLESINGRIYFEEGSFVPPAVRESEDQTTETPVEITPSELTPTPESLEPTVPIEAEEGEEVQ